MNHIDLTCPWFPPDARAVCLDTEYARGTIAMHREHGVALSLGGSALEPDARFLSTRPSADAVTVRPRARS